MTSILPIILILAGVVIFSTTADSRTQKAGRKCSSTLQARRTKYALSMMGFYMWWMIGGLILKYDTKLKAPAGVTALQPLDSTVHTIKSDALLTCLTAKKGNGTGKIFRIPLILSMFVRYYAYPSVIQ